MIRVGDIERFLFVVGAPRCGTTTLSHFLKAHPAIRFPVVKETHFFAQNDLRGLSDSELKRRVEQDYLQRFFRRGAQVVGADCSVTYLYSPELLEPVLRLWPDSRFVIALRDPLQMLPSLHQRLLFMGDESLTNFAKAWAAVPDRAQGRKIPRGCVEPRWLRYDEAARFGTYAERLFSVVGRDRCFPLIFDDLIADPAGQYGKLMDFCGLDPVPGTDFRPQRSGKAVRMQWLQRTLKRPPSFLMRRLAKDAYLRRSSGEDEAGADTQAKALSLRKRLLQWNKVIAPAEPLSPQLQLELRAHFKPEIDRLGRLIGRDLSSWLLPSEQRAGATRQSQKVTRQEFARPTA
jgi:hypothetical protein